MVFVSGMPFSCDYPFQVPQHAVSPRGSHWYIIIIDHCWPWINKKRTQRVTASTTEVWGLEVRCLGCPASPGSRLKNPSSASSSTTTVSSPTPTRGITTTCVHSSVDVFNPSCPPAPRPQWNFLEELAQVAGPQALRNMPLFVR